MFTHLRQRLTEAGRRFVHHLGQRLLAATKPCTIPLVIATLADLSRSKPDLIAENALLRQQLLILQRSVKRPRRPSASYTLPPCAPLSSQERGAWRGSNTFQAEACRKLSRRLDDFATNINLYGTPVQPLWQGPQPL